MWGQAYPEAKMWGCPGMMEKEPDVNWTGEIPFSTRPFTYPSVDSPDPLDGMWDWNEIQPMHFDTEVNPFTGTFHYTFLLRSRFGKSLFKQLQTTYFLTEIYFGNPCIAY